MDNDHLVEYLINIHCQGRSLQYLVDWKGYGVRLMCALGHSEPRVDPNFSRAHPAPP